MIKQLTKLSFWTTYYFITFCLVGGVYMSLSLLISSIIDQYSFEVQIDFIVSFVTLLTMLVYMITQKSPKRKWLNLMFMYVMPILLIYDFYNISITLNYFRLRH